MNKLSNPAFVVRLLNEHGIRLKKKWGQNFLVDENILNKIVATAAIKAGDHIVEVGPGIGALTQLLAHQAKQVTAFEIDERLLPVLEETLGQYNNVTFVLQDALKVDYSSLCADGPFKLVANLPYNVATPLIFRWLKEYHHCFSMLVCMVQKEVAQRIVAPPGGKDYGALSVICQYSAKVEIAFDVPRTVFFPRPDVSSSVITMIPEKQVPFCTEEENIFFRIVEAVFAQRRKTMLNTLHSFFAISKEELLRIGQIAGIDLGRRGETLDVHEFARLARLFYNNKDVTDV